MYKIVFLLFFLLALTTLFIATREESKAVTINSPVLSGNPILVLNR